MSTLKVANIHFEATGTNRVEYVANNINFRTGGGNFTISVGGTESLNVNASSVMISGANILASVAAAATSANLTSAWGTANAALANTNATFAGNLTLGINQTLFVGNATVNTAISAGSITTNGVALDIGRNRIINGAMEIDQRNAGALLSAPQNLYTVDRWSTYYNGGGVYSAQQSTTVPSGFINSLKLTVTTADSSIAAGDYYFLNYAVEGTNCTDLDYGLSTAKTTTLSFWVRSSVTGTHSGGVQNSATTRSYVFTYTINVADTWEYKSITIQGDSTGTWLTTTGIGYQIRLNLGTGSTYQASSGSWTATNAFAATGAAQWIATNGATFYITGVQLEVGSVATPFERRQYGQELALCQRYYEIVYCWFAQQECSNGNIFATTLPWLVQKRASPTVTYVSGTLSSCSMNVYVSDAHSGSFYLLNNSGGNNNIALQNGLFKVSAEL